VAKVASLSRPTVLVIDTSYLLELYCVPHYSKDASHAAIKARFAKAIEQKSLFYLPFPVILEVANHIVDGREPGPRQKLAERFVGDILGSFEKAQPFVITPALDEESLKELLQRFANEFAAQRVGLTDTSIIHEAKRLKQKYGERYNVFIWTKDKR
jgi:predicted nucleic acid-binding protein